MGRLVSPRTDRGGTMLFWQLLLDGVQVGATYALMAVGFAIIFGSTKVFHYAHGSVYVVAGYAFYYCLAVLAWPWWAAVVASAVSAVLFGTAIDRFVYRPIQRDEGSFFTVFVASFGVAVVTENLINIVFGSSFVSVTTTLSRGAPIAEGLVLSWLGVIAVAVAIVLFSLLHLFFSRTDAGVALRALSENPDLIRGFGLSSWRLSRYAFAIGSLLVVPAAVTATCVTGLTPTSGHRVMLISLAATIIGGIGSLRGAGLGGLLLGIAESLAVWKLSTGWSEAVAFVILFAFIVARPAGLFGYRGRV
jgi:branched-chain amino acid transport system permease protein